MTNRPDNISIIEHNGMRWINVEHADRAAVEYLKQNFDFHVLDYEDVMTTNHRSKIDKYDEYLFIVLLFPVFNRKKKQIEPAEINFFLGPDYLITVHNNEMPTFIDMFQLCEADDRARNSLMKSSPQFLLYKVLQRLFQYCYPIMDHIDTEIQDLESSIFDHDQTEQQKLLQSILMVRHNIIDMRKIMQPHRTTLARLVKPSVELGDHHNYELNKEYEDYFDDLQDYTQEIWDQLESFKESVDALHETNESLISNRINDVMKTLTVFSVIMLPASVLAGVFGMNARNTPFVGGQLDFWMMVGVTVTSIVLTLFYIRRKHMWWPLVRKR